MKINWKALGSVLWHGGRIALEAAEVLENSGVLRMSGKAQTAFIVAAAIEHAAGNRANLLADTTPPIIVPAPTTPPFTPPSGTTGE